MKSLPSENSHHPSSRSAPCPVCAQMVSSLSQTPTARAVSRRDTTGVTVSLAAILVLGGCLLCRLVSQAVSCHLRCVHSLVAPPEGALLPLQQVPILLPRAAAVPLRFFISLPAVVDSALSLYMAPCTCKVAKAQRESHFAPNPQTCQPISRMDPEPRSAASDLLCLLNLPRAPKCLPYSYFYCKLMPNSPLFLYYYTVNKIYL